MISRKSKLVVALMMGLVIIGCIDKSGPSNLTNVGPTPQSETDATIPTIVFDVTPSIDLDYLNDYLFASEIAGCMLPCWEGLRIGQSNQQDIQRVFDTTFGFDNTIDFFDGTIRFSRVWVVESPGLETTGYEWTMNEGRDFFSLQLVTDSAKELRGIQFRNIYSPYSPSEILRRLGSPDYIWFVSREVVSAEASDIITEVRLVMAYSDGISFSFIEGLRTNEYCLNDEPSRNAVHIVESFESFTNGTALQNEWVFSYVERQELQPIQESLGITPVEFTEIAVSESSCLDLTIEE